MLTKTCRYSYEYQGFSEMFKREVELRYRTMALSEDWLKGALPKLF